MTSRVWGGVVSLALAVTATAGEFSKQPVGSAGGWANTLAAAALGGKLYTVESSGSLYATDPASARGARLKADFGARRSLRRRRACSIEKDGSLYHPARGRLVEAVGPRGGGPTRWRRGAQRHAVHRRSQRRAIRERSRGGHVAADRGADFAGTKFLLRRRQVCLDREEWMLYLVNPRTAAGAGDEAGAWASVEAGGDGGRYALHRGRRMAGCMRRTPARERGRVGDSGGRFGWWMNGSLYGIDAGGNLFRAAPRLG